MGNGVALVAVLTFLFAAHLPSPSLRAGQIAGQSIVATQRVSYIDRAATAAQRKAAEARVPAVYRSNADVVEQRRRQANAFLTRLGPVLTSDQSPASRLKTIRSLVPPGVTPGRLQQFLGLSPGQLSDVETQSQEVLSQAAASSFDETQLTATELSLVGMLPSTLSANERAAIGVVLAMFMAPTRVIDIQATERARQRAARAVPPAVATVYPGQVIVRRGDLITPTIEAQLKALGLQTKRTGWQDVVAGILYASAIVAMLFWYLYAFQPGVLANGRILLLLDACLIVTVVLARLIGVDHVLLPYFVPVAAATTFAAALVAPEACIALALAIALLAGWVASNSFELALYYFLTAAAGALAIRKIRRLNQFILAGAYIALFALLTQLAFGFIDRVYDLNALQDYVMSSAFNGFVSAALALGAFALLSGAFGVTTSLHLLELGQPNHPLLRRLMVKAPGTYNHSLVLATMVEHAAEEIGANSLAAKLGALYHDVGKTTNPHAFVENQLGMSNVHDDLEPEESARIIRGHVGHGIRLARQYRLPGLVLDAIAEHHGTMTISYFLQRARSMARQEPIDLALYTYPGPKPQSRETALLMLADGSEAAVRASEDHSPGAIRKIVERIFRDRIESGQLDESPLTLHDIAVTTNAFCAVLNSLYHPRIDYPEPIEVATVQPMTQQVPDEPLLPGDRVAL